MAKMKLFDKAAKALTGNNGIITLTEDQSNLLNSLAQMRQMANNNYLLAAQQIARSHSKDLSKHEFMPTPGQPGRIDLVSHEHLRELAAAQQQAQVRAVPAQVAQPIKEEEKAG